MGFLEWMGFTRARDAPETENRPSLPEVTDNVRDSGQTFFFGTAASGERVDEKSAIPVTLLFGSTALVGMCLLLPRSIPCCVTIRAR